MKSLWALSHSGSTIWSANDEIETTMYSIKKYCFQVLQYFSPKSIAMPCAILNMQPVLKSIAILIAIIAILIAIIAILRNTYYNNCNIDNPGQLHYYCLLVLHFALLCWSADVTKYLLFLAQASHELVPPDVSRIYLHYAVLVEFTKHKSSFLSVYWIQLPAAVWVSLTFYLNILLQFLQSTLFSSQVAFNWIMASAVSYKRIQIQCNTNTMWKVHNTYTQIMKTY